MSTSGTSADSTRIGGRCHDHQGVSCYRTGTRGVKSWGTQRLSRMFMDVTLLLCFRS